MQIYPTLNSSYGAITVQIRDYTGANLKIISMKGISVHSEIIDEPKQAIYLNGLSQGIYLVVVTTSEGINYLKKIVVE